MTPRLLPHVQCSVTHVCIYSTPFGYCSALAHSLDAEYPESPSRIALECAHNAGMACITVPFSEACISFWVAVSWQSSLGLYFAYYRMQCRGDTKPFGPGCFSL